ncbi:MAG: sugar kinase [Alphaproteobacteria bacterium]|nr:sugar kinase [Alphaproteobacteria bacterium]
MREIISVGECMIELARRADGAFDLRVGGDTFNTAIYLARLGAPVTYMTAVGDDPYSARIIATARGENVNDEMILTIAGRMPGLYLIETSAGERSFWYWRDQAPARELFELASAGQLVARLKEAGTIYISGVTLSLYSARGLDVLHEALAEARHNGAKVVIDSNYRPVGWRHDAGRARETYARFWPQADIALPSFEDEQALWDDAGPEDTFARMARFGVAETCLKMAERGAVVELDGSLVPITPATAISLVDTTAAGDSFSAAYLWARLNGRSAAAAAAHGNRLAGIVIQHPGAIAPKSATARFGQ